MTEEKTTELSLQDIIDQGPADLDGNQPREERSNNKQETHTVFFSGMSSVQHHMKQFPAFRVDNPSLASGIQWFWNKQMNSLVSRIMENCYREKKRCKVKVYYRYPAYDLNNQILGEAYQAEEYVEPY